MSIEQQQSIVWWQFSAFCPMSLHTRKCNANQAILCSVIDVPLNRFESMGAKKCLFICAFTLFSGDWGSERESARELVKFDMCECESNESDHIFINKQNIKKNMWFESPLLSSLTFIIIIIGEQHAGRLNVRLRIEWLPSLATLRCDESDQCLSLKWHCLMFTHAGKAVSTITPQMADNQTTVTNLIFESKKERPKNASFDSCFCRAHYPAADS